MSNFEVEVQILLEISSQRTYEKLYNYRCTVFYVQSDPYTLLMMASH